MLSTFIAGGILNSIALLLDDNYWLIGVYFIWSSVTLEASETKLILKWNVFWSSMCIVMCLVSAGLFPDVKEVGEGAKGTRAGGYSRGYSRK